MRNNRLVRIAVCRVRMIVSRNVKRGRIFLSCAVAFAMLLEMVAGGVLFASGAPNPGALPTGGRIVSGNGSISVTGNQMTVTQQQSKMIANWDTFNIGQNAGVTFNQPNALSSALNRITDSNPSQIFGSLTANGQVFLLNPSGIIFGPTAQVNVGGIVASSLNLSNSDFLAGNYRFINAGSAGAILNQGNITTSDYGVVALIAPQVTNSGTITTPKGSAGLAAGNRVLLDFAGDGLINLSVSEAALDAAIENSGAVRADGGKVVMTASAASALTATVVNNTGEIEAKSISERNGVIVLDGGTEGIVSNTGAINAMGNDPGLTGGQITVSGNKVNLGGTGVIDASGDSGGGAIAVVAQGSGSFATVESGVRISADAVGSGHGGTVGLSTNGDMDFGGRIYVRALGAGFGGYAYLWADALLSYTGLADMTGALGAGTFGIFASNINIAASGGNITGALLGTQLGLANVQMEALSGNVNVNDPVSWASGFGLQFLAMKDINVNAAVSGGSVSLRADYYGNNSGTVNFTASGHITAYSSVLYYNPSDYLNPTDFSPYVTGSFTAWMLVNDLDHLQAMNTNLGGLYALGRTIDAGATSTWNWDGTRHQGFEPIGTLADPFTGSFYGGGCEISGLVINRPNTDYVGLFGYAPGVVINSVNMANVNITGRDYVGGVGGQVGGIESSSNSGAVSGRDFVGGLAGLSDSSYGIDYSSNHGSVTGNNYTGGLVGQVEIGTIYSSYDDGDVTGISYTGGLAGQAVSSNIESSYNTGAVYSSLDRVGGVAGYASDSRITSSFNTGTVHGRYDVGGVAGYVENSSILISHNEGLVIGYGMVGGVAGRIENSVVDSSYNIGTVWGTAGDKIGGVVGLATGSSSISYSWNTGLVAGYSGSDSVGGVAGEISNSTIGDSYNTGAVNGNVDVGGVVGYIYDFVAGNAQVFGSHNTGHVDGTYNVGGVAGEVYEHLGDAYISDSYNTGTVSGSNSVGGVAGMLHIDTGGTAGVSYSFNTGPVTGTYYAGGLVGYADGLNGTAYIDNSYNMGPTAGNIYVGGVAGKVNYGSVSNVYNTGAVTGNSNVDALVGGASGANTFSNNYFDADTTGLNGQLYGSSKSSVDMMKQSTFQPGTGNWDFTSTWGIVEGISYPYLRWQFSGTPQILSGMLNVSGGGKVIQAVLDGTFLAQSFTGADGFYYFALPSGSVAGGTNLLTYVSGSGTRGASVYLADGSHMTGMEIFHDILRAGPGESNTGLGTAKGALNDSAIFYSVSGGNLTFDQVASFVTSSYTLDGNVTTYGNGAQAYNGPVTLARNAVLTSGLDIDIYDSITGTGGYNLTLRADSEGTGTGTVDFGGTGSIDLTGGTGGGNKISIYYNPTDYAHPTDYSGNVAQGNLTVYMLVNDVGPQYVLATSHGLQAMKNNLAGTYALGTDIDASATSGWNGGLGFEQVGIFGIAPFSGIFDGDGHTINGLTINRPLTDYVGLFGFAVGATIRNVGLTGGSITGQNFVGGVVGGASHGPGISNSYNTNEVTGFHHIGGLVGYAEDTVLADSYNTGAVSGNVTVGGLAGEIRNVSILGSYNTGTVNGTDEIGGLVGYYSSSAINYSYNSGEVTGTGDYIGGIAGWAENDSGIGNSHNTGVVTGNDFTGGLAGGINGSSAIHDSYNTGEVMGSGYYVGGLTGMLLDSSTISGSYNTGSVRGSSNIGGLAGKLYNASTINNSYNLGPVGGNDNVGGLAGGVDSGSITNSYNAGMVTGSSNVDALVGGAIGVNTFSNNYFDSDTTGFLTSSYGTGKTTGEMMTRSTFQPGTEDWDFTGVWSIVEGISYPYLQWYGTPQILSGTLDVTGGGKAIQAALDGTELAKTYTGANGFFYFALPSGSVASGGNLLTYVSGDTSTKGDSVYLADGGHMTGLSILSNTVAAGAGESNIGLATAKGGLGSSDIIYDVAGLYLTLNQDMSLVTSSYNLAGDITTSGTGSQTFNGPVTLLSSAVLTSGRDINVNGAVTGTGGYNLTLRADALGTGTGTVNFGPSGVIDLTGGSGGGNKISICYNSTDFAHPTPFSSYVTNGDLTAYMLVNDVDHLQLMNTNFTGTYALGRDIDASSTSTWNFDGTSYLGFEPVGGNGTQFTGIFNGGSHVISGLTINRPDSDFIGLFGAVSGAHISNVGLGDGNITGHNDVGSVGGWVLNSAISNTYNTGAVSGTGDRVGGVAGYISNSSINGSYNTGTVSGGGNSVGGVAGYVSAGSSIGNSYNTGGIIGSDSGNSVGGVAGSVYGSVINFSFNTGTVTGNGLVGGVAGDVTDSSIIYQSYNTGAVSGSNSIGGVAGELAFGGTIAVAYNRGAVSGGDYVGGVAGFVYSGYIGSSYNTGAVLGNADVGGVAGYLGNGGQITYSYNLGPVSGVDAVGGVAGRVYDSWVACAYNTGMIFGSTNVDALAGSVQGTSTVSNCFFDSETTGLVSSGYGTAKTTAEMMRQATFTGWDFGSTWGIIEDTSYPYPQSQGTPQVVSGMLDTGEGNINILAAVDGNLLGNSHTGANGFYYFALPSGSVYSGGNLLTYVSGESTKGASVYLSGGTHMTGLSILSNTLFAGSDESNTGLGNAKGGLTSADILYSVSGTDLTLSPNINFLADYNIDGNVMTSGTGAQTYEGYGSLLSNAILTSGGNININGLIMSSGGWDLTLRADSGGTGTGTVNFGASGAIDLAGGSSTIYYNPTDYAHPTDYSSYITNGGFTAYMLVNDIDHLQLMTTNLSGTYALGKNIDASETSGWHGGDGFDPVGTNGTPFTGIFYGDSHVISGLTINRPLTDYVGLFGFASNATIGSVGLIDGGINGRNWVGGLAGVVVSYYGTATISNSYNTGTVTGSGECVGGLVGHVEGQGGTATISDSFNTGAVTGNSNVGGLVGVVDSYYGIATISNSYNAGTVTGSDERIGGLAGAVDGDNGTATIDNSYNVGKVNGNNYVGGLAGYVDGDFGTVTISNSYNSRGVTGVNDVGGLVGHVDGDWGTVTISNSYHSRAVSGVNNVGGLAGYVDGNNGEVTISNAYNTGPVSGDTSVGGLAGYVDENNGSVTLSYSYNTAIVIGNSNVDALIGSGSGTFSNLYFDKETTGFAASSYGTGKSTSEMMTWSTFQPGGGIGAGDWDFGGTWSMVEGVSYPYLQWQFGGDTPQIVSGILDTARGGLSIRAAVDGTAFGKSHTGANGFYYFALPRDSVPYGANLLTYIDGDSTKGASVYRSYGDHMTGLSILSNTLLAGDGEGISALAIALGSISSPDALYTASGVAVTTITVKPDINLVTDSFELNGILLTSGTGSQTYNGPVTFSLASELHSGTGGIAFNGEVTGNWLYLYSTGPVTQSAPISVIGLSLQGTGGDYQLTDSCNSVATLAADTGTVNFYNSGDFNIGSIWVDGITTTGDTMLGSPGTVTQTKPIRANGLLLQGGGNFQLTDPGNSVTTLAAEAETVNFRNSGGFIIGSVGGSDGITTLWGDTILQSTGTVTQTAPISSSGLLLLGIGGDYQLTNPGNYVYTLAADTGTVSFRSPSDFYIGSISGPSGTVDGITTTSSTTLFSNGYVGQWAPITANGLLLLGVGGNYELTDPGNSVTTLAADTGSVNFQNARGFNIGTVGGTAGITTSGDTWLNVSATGSIETVTQTAPIRADGLLLQDNDACYLLTDTQNRVTTLAAAVGGLDFRSLNGFDIGYVGDIAGIQTYWYLTLSSSGTVTQSAGFDTGLLLILGSGGNFQLTNPGNSVRAGLAADTGTFNFSSDGDFNIDSISGVTGITTTSNTILYGNGNVTQSAPITAAGLLLQGPDGNFQLTDPGNSVTTLAADTGTVNFRNSSGFNIGSVGGVNGITTTCDTTLYSMGTVTQSAAITADGLLLMGPGGNFQLDDNGNIVTTLAADTGTLTFWHAGDFSIGSVGGVNGITTTSDTILSSSGNVTQSAPITADGLLLVDTDASYLLSDEGNRVTTLAANVWGLYFKSMDGFNIGSVGGVNGITTTSDTILLSTGNVTQSAPITAAGLILVGLGGNFQLTGPGNSVTTLAAYAGTLNFRNAGGFDIGSLYAVDGITTASDTTLESTGSVTQSAAISADGLLLRGPGGNFQLTDPGNSVYTLAADTGTVNFRNSGALTIGTVGGIAGITTTSTTTVRAGGDLTLEQIVAADSPALDTAIILATSGNFINNFGPGALDPGTGTWLVYSTDPRLDSGNGLVSDFIQYDAAYPAAPVVTGNGFLYSLAPVISVSLTGEVSKIYDATIGATLDSAVNYASSEAVAGDTVNLNLPASGTFDDKHVGTGKTVSVSGIDIINATDSGGSIPVYGYHLASDSISGSVGVITPASLEIFAATDTKVYDSTTVSNAAPTVSGLLGGDSISLNQIFDSKNAGNRTLLLNYTINDGNNGNNYAVTEATADGTISTDPITVAANNLTKQAGSPDPALSYGITSGQLLGTDSLAGGLTRAAGESAGVYPILLGTLGNENYAITFVNGNLTITASTVPTETVTDTVQSTLNNSQTVENGTSNVNNPLTNGGTTDNGGSPLSVNGAPMLTSISSSGDNGSTGGGSTGGGSTGGGSTGGGPSGGTGSSGTGSSGGPTPPQLAPPTLTANEYQQAGTEAQNSGAFGTAAVNFHQEANVYLQNGSLPQGRQAFENSVMADLQNYFNFAGIGGFPANGSGSSVTHDMDVYIPGVKAPESAGNSSGGQTRTKGAGPVGPLLHKTGLEDLPRDTAVVYTLIFHDRLELIVGFQSGLKRVSIPIDAAALWRDVNVLRASLQRRTRWDFLPQAQKLYQLLVKPIELELKIHGIETLVFIPDGALRTVPFAALHDGDRFLIEKYSVAITPSLELTDPRPRWRKDTKVLSAGLTESVQGFAPLANVKPELDGIQGLYGGSDRLENNTFCEMKVSQSLRENAYSIVHMATHGSFAPTGADTFLLAWDGKIGMDQLGHLMERNGSGKGRVELLCLSACETAAGDDKAALGLAGVAIRAGARSALATLWSVSDQAAPELVIEFYRGLRDPSISKAEALRAAQLKLIDDPRYRHPFYWSPFLLIGNWM